MRFDVDGVFAEDVFCADDGVMFWLLLYKLTNGLFELIFCCLNADVGVFVEDRNGVLGVPVVIFLPVEKNGLLATDKGTIAFGVERVFRRGVFGVVTFSILRRGVVSCFALGFALTGEVGVSSIFVNEFPPVTLPRRHVTNGDVSIGKYFGVRRPIMSSESSESRLIGPSRRRPLD